jgi:DUF2911 family protein
MKPPQLWYRLGLLLLLPAPVAAQVRASEPASISQTVDGTKLTVTYSRPRARARDSLFGKVVTWGEVWTPGANLATTLELSKNAKLEGHPIRAPIRSPSRWENRRPTWAATTTSGACRATARVPNRLRSS